MMPQRCAVIDGKLVLEWHDAQVALDGATLRSNCRCAECRYIALTNDALATDNAIHHEAVTVLAASPMGYGVQLHFSDDHRRGVFPWSYLFGIGTALQ